MPNANEKFIKSCCTSKWAQGGSISLINGYIQGKLLFLYAANFLILRSMDVLIFVCLGCSEWQWCGSLCDKRGQERGLRPADGPVSVTTRPLVTAQRQQPHGSFLWVLPAPGQPLHPLPRLLLLRWDRRPLRERREKATEGRWAAVLGKRLSSPSYKSLKIWSSVTAAKLHF